MSAVFSFLIAFLLSGDVNFAPELKELRYRYGFEVIVIHNPQVSDALRTVANETYCYQSLWFAIPSVSVTPLQFDEVKENCKFDEKFRIFITRRPQD